MKIKITLTTLLSLSLLLSLTLFAQSSTTFFDDADVFFSQYAQHNGVDYSKLAEDRSPLDDLIAMVRTYPLEEQDDATQKAFLINAYNLLVIHGVLIEYPTPSVMDIGGFFDRKRYQVAGKYMTLNGLEKDLLLKKYPDPRLHFVLVCGAVGCPPIYSKAYRPRILDMQLDMRTKMSINDPSFIQVQGEKALISEIFKWYVKDFGNSEANVINFINSYRNIPLPSNTNIGYYTYDWSLNEVDISQIGSSPISQNQEKTATTDFDVSANNAARYVVSAAIPKGTTESKLFNNLYSETTDGPTEDLTSRTSFFTSWLSFVYGVSNRFNAGFDVRYRRTRTDVSESNSPFDVLGSGGDRERAQFTTIGPKIRWAPVPKWKNFSIQSALWFTLADDLEGTADKPFIDWNKTTWWTQFFNDIPLGTKFSAFTEIDFLWEDIGGEDSDFNRISTPATLILSYFPTPQSTIYVLGSYSPFWQENYDYFYQGGIGAKYQITRQFELEALYTAFSNDFLQTVGGQAQTINFGIRVNR